MARIRFGYLLPTDWVIAETQEAPVVLENSKPTQESSKVTMPLP